MEISELKSLVRGGLNPDGFSLQAASLASTRVNRLAADYLPEGRFRLAAGAVAAGDDHTSITVRGKGVDLPFRGMPVSLRFSLGAEGAADASLHAAAPPGWRLNAAFPPLRGTAAAQLPFAAAPVATLLLSSADAGGPAVAVAGTVDLAAATGGLAELLGLATLQTRGTARLAAQGREFHELALTATAAERVDLGLFTVERVTVGVGTALRHDPLRKKTVASSFVRLGATFPFLARGVPRGLPVSATVYDLGGRIRFSADLNDAVDAALDEIQNLLGTRLGSEVHLQGLLPAGPGFSLGSVIRLRDLFVDLTPGGASRVELVGIGVESAGTWHLLTLPSGRELTAGNVFLDFRVFDP
ncbi:MAG TPA: hypothetical protein VK358_04475, partial [Longimicrobium sp.]|nr:hypothetical protein [Longimicrobium sp.]